MDITTGAATSVEDDLKVAGIGYTGVEFGQGEIGEGIRVGTDIVVHVHAAASGTAMVVAVVDVRIGRAIVASCNPTVGSMDRSTRTPRVEVFEER